MIFPSSDEIVYQHTNLQSPIQLNSKKINKLIKHSLTD